jgi:hypothetical protein
MTKHPAESEHGLITISVWRDQQGKRGQYLGDAMFHPNLGWRFFPDIPGRRISWKRTTWEKTLPKWTGGLDGTISAYVRYEKGRRIELDVRAAAPVWEAA